jgi:hypothetical protein
MFLPVLLSIQRDSYNAIGPKFFQNLFIGVLIDQNYEKRPKRQFENMKIISRIVYTSGMLLFFLMIVVPTAYYLIKIFIMVLVTVSLTLRALYTGRVFLHPTVLKINLFLVIVGVLYLIWGMVNNAPGAPRVGTVFVLWPLLYILYITGARKATTLSDLVKVLVFSSFAIAAHTFIFLLVSFSVLPDFFYLDLEGIKGLGGSKGMVEFELQSLVSLTFLIPFFFAAIISWPNNRNTPVRKGWIWLVFLLLLPVAFLSGRRGLWLVLLICPMFTVFFYRFYRGMGRSFWSRITLQVGRISAPIMLVLIGLAFTEVLNLEVMWKYFLIAFDFSQPYGTSAGIRTFQFLAMTNEWLSNLSNFLIGRGLGNSLLINRTLHEFELGYIALLFHTGIIGFSIYFFPVMWIYWMGRKIIKKSPNFGLIYMIPMLSGMTGMLIAHATNPYLGKYDSLWALFMPISFINYWLIKKNEFT